MEQDKAEMTNDKGSKGVGFVNWEEKLALKLKSLLDKGYGLPGRLGFGEGATWARAETIKEYEEREARLKSLLKEMDEYLSRSSKEQIGSGSIFHRQIKDLIK